MSYIDKIVTPTGGEYDLHDKRVDNINSFNYEVVTTLPDASSNTMYKIYLVSSSPTQTSDIYTEYITVDKGSSANPRYVWEKFGEISQPDLSGYVSTAVTHTFSGTPATIKVSGTPNGSVTSTFTGTAATIKGGYTPAGSVTSTFSGTAATIKVSGTPNGNLSTTKSIVEVKPDTTGTAANKYTPAGSVTLSGGSTTTVNNPTKKTVVTSVNGSSASGDTSIPYWHVGGTNNHTLYLDKIVVGTGDSITTSQVTVKTGNPTASFTGTDTYFKTASSVVTDATWAGAATTFSGSYTPAGSVGSTFSGTAATVSSSYTPAGTVGSTFSGASTTFSGSYTPGGTVTHNL